MNCKRGDTYGVEVEVDCYFEHVDELLLLIENLRHDGTSTWKIDDVLGSPLAQEVMLTGSPVQGCCPPAY